MNTPNSRLDGKTAIVTGGRRGIGKAIALAFAGAGADVAVCDRVVEDGALETAAGEIRRLGRRSLAVRADTSRKDEVDAMVQRVVDEFGGIDILVNNAGINVRGKLLEMPEEDWNTLMGVNLKGYFLCAQSVGKRMVERKTGNIISIASQSAFKASPGRGAYCIAKAGVVMLTRALAQTSAATEYAPTQLPPAWPRRNSAEGPVVAGATRPTWRRELPRYRWVESPTLKT